MKPLIAGSVVLALAGCGGTGNLFGPTPEPVANPEPAPIWFHASRGQCVPIEGTPAEQAVLAGGENRPLASLAGDTFDYPVEVLFVNDTETAIYVQGTANCARFLETVL